MYVRMLRPLKSHPSLVLMPHDLSQSSADDGCLLRLGCLLNLTGFRLQVGVRMLSKIYGTVGHPLCILGVKYFESAPV